MEIRNINILVCVIRFQSLLSVVYLWLYHINPTMAGHVTNNGWACNQQWLTRTYMGGPL